MALYVLQLSDIHFTTRIDDETKVHEDVHYELGFVFAASQPWLLRRLCKRMLRQWGGRAFLERAFDQLRSYPANPLTHELADILRNPDYIVDWD